MDPKVEWALGGGVEASGPPGAGLGVPKECGGVAGGAKNDSGEAHW